MGIFRKIGSALGLGSAGTKQVSSDIGYRGEAERGLKRLEARATGKTPSIAGIAGKQAMSELGSRLSGSLRGASGISSALKQKMASRQGAELAGKGAKGIAMAEAQERLGAEQLHQKGLQDLIGAGQRQEQMKSAAAAADAARKQQFAGALIQAAGGAYGGSLLAKAKRGQG